jgi:hypothetical protein
VAGFAVAAVAVLRPFARPDAARPVPALAAFAGLRAVPVREAAPLAADFARPVAGFVAPFVLVAARPRVPVAALVDLVRDVAVLAGAFRAAVPRVAPVLVVAALRPVVPRLPAAVALRFGAAAARGAFAAAALRPAVPRVPRAAGRRVCDRRRGFFCGSCSGAASAGSGPPSGICSVSSLMR